MGIISSVFKQTIWQTIGKAVTSISTFIILGIISRNYKEAGTGIFTLSLTYLSMINFLVDFGFNAHALKKFQIEEFRRLLGTRILWSAVLIILAIFTLPFWPFTVPEFSKAVIFGSLAVLGSAVFVTCNLIFQRKLRYDLSVIASIFGTLISLVFYIYLSLQKYPVSFLLFAYSVGWIFIAAASLFFVKKFLSKITPIFDFLYIKNLFKDSWPIAVTLTLNVVYFRLDSFMIAYFKGVSDAGIYNVAFSTFQSALVVPTFVMNSYYPLMLKSLSKIKLVGLGLAGLAIVGTLLTLFLSPAIINLLTGGSFKGSIESLRILSLGFPAFFLSALLMWFLVTLGKYKQLLIIYALGLLINAGLNLIFIPQHSFYAAAWITVISEYLILTAQAMVLSLR